MRSAPAASAARGLVGAQGPGARAEALGHRPGHLRRVAPQGLVDHDRVHLPPFLRAPLRRAARRSRRPDATTPAPLRRRPTGGSTTPETLIPEEGGHGRGGTAARRDADGDELRPAGRRRHRPRGRGRSSIGGGIIGASVAVHLARLGWTDTVVLERSRVSSGTSWHAAGLMTRTRGTHVQTELAGYSRDFYEGLAALSGVDVGYYPNGSLSLARTPERLTELRYALTMAHHHGLPARELTPDEIAAVSPLLAVDDLAGGVLFEDDATVNPGWAAFATAKAAFDLGVRVVEGVRVTGFRLDRGRVVAVETDRGAVECEVAVIAAGLWSRDLGLLAGARLRAAPLRALLGADRAGGRRHPRPAHHPRPRRLASTCVTTAAACSSARSSPTAGRARRRRSRRTSPSASSSRTWSTSRGRSPRRASACRRSAEARFAHYLCAPESFTPDGNFLLGETAEVAGLFVAAGMNSQGIILGPGVGRALAEWIDAGRADRGRGRPRRAPLLAGAGQRGLPLRAHARVAGPAVRDALAVPAARHGARPAARAAVRPARRRRRLLRRGGRLGAAPTGTRRPGERPEYALLLRPAELVRRGRRRAPRRARGASRCSTSPRSPSSASRARSALADRPARLHRGPRPAARQRSSTRPCSTRAAGSSSTPRSRGSATDAFLVVTSAAAQTKAFHWLRRHRTPAGPSSPTSPPGSACSRSPARARATCSRASPTPT